MLVRIAVLALVFTGLTAAAPPPPILPGAASYADFAVLTLGAPVIVRATIGRAERIDPAQAPGVAAGQVRVLLGAALAGAVVAPGDVPAMIEYLADVPADARGKPPRLKGADVLLFLRDTAGSYSLSNAHGQLGWSAAAEATVRRILAEARSGSVPVVNGVGNAFRVPGSVPGEAESQFFLTTADGKPVSLVVLTRPGQPQRLSVALGEVIDEAAGGVPRDTLLWYRLACFLPPGLPAAAAPDKDGASDSAEAGALAADYAFVLKALGPCGRTLP